MTFLAQEVPKPQIPKSYKDIAEEVFSMLGLLLCPVPKQVAAVDDAAGDKRELWVDLFSVTALLL